MRVPKLTRERLLECLHYDPLTGLFTWLVQMGNARVGEAAGWDDCGYCRLAIDGEKLMAHKLAWFWAHGIWPDEIDHQNRKRNDNRLLNLRLATRSQNNANARKPKDNRSGFKGVAVRPNGGYTAQIGFNKKKHHLGCFDDPAEAHEAYKKAAAGLYKEFARSG